MRTDERIQEIDSLPVEDRTLVAEGDLQSGCITPIGIDEVFQEIWSRVT